MKSMNRYSLLGILACCCLLIQPSCTNKDNFKYGSVKEVSGEAPSLFSIDKYVFDPQGSQQTFSLVSGSSWSLDSCPSWVSVSPTNGPEGRTLITIMSNLNEDWTDREGALTFLLNGKERFTLPVSQDCPRLNLIVEDKPSQLEVSEDNNVSQNHPDGGYNFPFLWSHKTGETKSVTLSVRSNMKWRLTLDNVEWFAISKDNENWIEPGDDDTIVLDGEGNETLYLNTPKHNYTSAMVENAHLSLVAYTNEERDTPIASAAIANWTVYLSQTNLRFLVGTDDDTELGTDPFEIDFDEFGFLKDTDEMQQTVIVDCELEWRLIEKGASIDVENTQGGNAYDENGGGQPPHFQVSIKHPGTQHPVNPELEKYENGFTIVPLRNGQEITEAARRITIEQDPYVFDLKSHEVTWPNGVWLNNGDRAYFLEENEPLVRTLTLETTGPWVVEPLTPEEQEWLELDSTTMAGEDTRDQTDHLHTIQYWVKKQNMRLEDIKAAIRVHAAYDWLPETSDLRQECQVTQNQFVFEEEYDKEEKGVLSATQLIDVENRSLIIHSSGPWELCVKQNGELVRVSETSSDCWVQTMNAVDTGNTDPGAPLQSNLTVGSNLPNVDDNPRTLVLVLRSLLHEALSGEEYEKTGYAPLEIPVTQRRFTFSLNDEEKNLDMTLAAYKGTFTDSFLIKSDGDWEIIDCPSWMDPDPRSATLAEGNVNRRVTLNPQVHGNTQSTRKGTIKLHCSYGDKTFDREVSVTQDALVFSVSGLSSSTTIAADVNFPYNNGYFGETQLSYHVDATKDLPWQYVQESSYDFLSSYRSGSTVEANGSKDGVLYPTYNTQKQKKEHKFYFRVNDDRFTDVVKSPTFTVSQDAFVWDNTSIGNMVFTALGGIHSGSSEIKFNCSGPWELDAPSWVNQQDLTYTSSPNFRLEVNKNTQQMNAERSEQVTLKSVMAPSSYNKTFTVRQLGYYFDNVATTLPTFSTLDAEDQPVTFQCAGGWEIPSEYWDRGTFSAKSGSGKADGSSLSITFHPADYIDDTKDRNESFVIRSTDNKEFTKTINFKQNKYVFELGQYIVKPSGPKETSSIYIDVEITSGDTWSVLNDYDTGIVTASDYYGRIRVTPKENYSLREVNTTIHIRSNRGNKTKNVGFTMPAYQFSVNATTLTMPASGSSSDLSRTFTITSSGGWKLTQDTDSKEWLTISSTTSAVAGQKTITVTAAANDSKDAAERKATLTLTSNDPLAASDKTKTIAVTQKAPSK